MVELLLQLTSFSLSLPDVVLNSPGMSYIRVSGDRASIVSRPLDRVLGFRVYTCGAWRDLWCLPTSSTLAALKYECSRQQAVFQERGIQGARKRIKLGVDAWACVNTPFLVVGT